MAESRAGEEAAAVHGHVGVRAGPGQATAQLLGLACLTLATCAVTVGVWAAVIGPSPLLSLFPALHTPPSPPPPPPPSPTAPMHHEATVGRQQEGVDEPAPDPWAAAVEQRVTALQRLAGARPLVLLSMELQPFTGWGKLGTVVAQALHEAGYYPGLLLPFNASRFAESSFALDGDLLALLSQQQAAGHVAGLMAHGAGRQHRTPFPVVAAIDGFFASRLPVKSTSVGHTIGLTFFDEPRVGAHTRAFAADYDIVITGSMWNHQTLQALQLGPEVRNLIQGVDTAWFSRAAAEDAPAATPPLPRWPGRFVVFSGGKLEPRKGQDLVLAAFVPFARAHPEALLVTAWENAQWSMYLPSATQLLSAEGRIVGPANLSLAGIAQWTRDNGLPDAAVHHLPLQDEASMRAVLARADLGVFPNRCEPGTNLVAMEALAMGVPCVIANNTGQADIALPSISFVLDSPRNPRLASTPLRDWGYSRLEDVLRLMDAAYRDPDGAREKGRRAALFIGERYTWDHYSHGLGLVFRELLPA